MQSERTGMPKGCTATSFLKTIALVFMFIDHAGKMLFANAVWMRLLGRIAFPIYAWCLVVGSCYTRSMPKYLLRLLIMFAVSQPFYMVALNHGWDEPNIFLQLAISLIGIWGMREKKNGSQIWAPVLAVVLATYTGCDYGWKGAVFIMLLWLARESRGGIAGVMTAFSLYWGTSSSQLTSFLGLDLSWLKETSFSAIANAVFRLQGMMVLALPFMLLPERPALKSFRMPRWVGYIIYPAHLAVLIVLEMFCLAGGTAAVYGRWSGLVLQPVLNLLGI